MALDSFVAKHKTFKIELLQNVNNKKKNQIKYRWRYRVLHTSMSSVRFLGDVKTFRFMSDLKLSL